MKAMKKQIVLLAMAMVLLLSTASTAFAAPKKNYVIAVVPKIIDSPLLAIAQEGAMKAGKELGVDVIWTGTSHYDSAAQIQVVEGLIQKGVNAILLAPNDPDSLVDIINTAVSQGIIVGTFDSDAPKSNRAFYCGTNNTALGKACGEAMLKLIKGRKDTVDCAILHGVPGASNLEDRITAFKKAVAGSKIKCLPAQPCNDDSNKAMEIMEQYTQANPSLDAWFVIGGWPFFTQVDSLPTLKEFAKKGGIIVTIDAAYPMLAYVKEGVVSVEIGQDFQAMGYLGVKSLYDKLNGKKVGSFVDTGMVYVDKSNIDKVIANTKPW
jgi:ribose transport system substrate-binding protein